MRRHKADLRHLDDRTLLFNLYLTQALVLLVALLLLWWQRRSPVLLFAAGDVASVAAAARGVAVAAAVLAVDAVLSRMAPDVMTDQTGLNEKLFARRPLWHMALICLVVSVCEELLFRGALQHWIGNYWTSVLFAAIHFRYLRHWLPTLAVFAISYVLGWLHLSTGSLIAPIAAHFLIDFANGYVLRRKAGQ